MNDQNIHEEIAFQLQKIEAYTKDLAEENLRIKEKLTKSEKDVIFWMDSSRYWSDSYFETKKIKVTP